MAESPKKQHTVEYIAIAGLVLVALIIGSSRFKKENKDDEVFSRKEFNKKWAEVEILEAKVTTEEKGISYAISGERIPFKSPFDEVKKEEDAGENVVLPAMAFQGMIWKSFRPQAIINNKVYDVNDVINVGEEKVLVKDISKDGIHLKYMGKEFIVRPK